MELASCQPSGTYKFKKTPTYWENRQKHTAVSE